MRGIAKYYLQKDDVTMPVQERYMESIKDIYKGLPVDFVHEHPKSNFINCHDLEPIPGEDFVHCIYRQANVPFSYCYEKLTPNCSQLKAPNNPYIFVHRQTSVKKYELNTDVNSNPFYQDLPIIEPDEHGSIMRYRDIIENAKAIHLIDSAFVHLVQRLDIYKNYFIYYHYYAAPERGVWYSENPNHMIYLWKPVL